MLKLKQKIRTGLKKDAAALYESLSVQAADVGLVKTSLGVVSGLLAEEKNHTDERKKLSRQIGVARKQERDPTELIAGVSAISEKLDRTASGYVSVCLLFYGITMPFFEPQRGC